MAKDKSPATPPGPFDPSRLLTCTPKHLPEHLLERAAMHAASVNPVNQSPISRIMQGIPESHPMLARIAVLTTRYWGAGGVNLNVGFLDAASDALKQKILYHMNLWAKPVRGQSANVVFTEHAGRVQQADVRIAFRGGDNGGYWSYVGTDILSIDREEPTMNLEGFSIDTPDSEFLRVVCHETGHTIGCPHEHMRAELVARIDEQKAINYFGETQHWTPEVVQEQVLTPIEEKSLWGTEHSDAHSIMCYQIPGLITKDGKPIIGGTKIDPQDYRFIQKVYPRPSAPAAAPGAREAAVVPGAAGSLSSARGEGAAPAAASLPAWADEEGTTIVEIRDGVTRIYIKSPPPPAPPARAAQAGGQSVYNTVVACIRGVLADDDIVIQPDFELGALGLDRKGRTEVGSCLNERLSLSDPFYDGDIGESMTVRRLAKNAENRQ